MLRGQFEDGEGTLREREEAIGWRERLGSHRALVEIDERDGALFVTPLVTSLDAESAPQLRQVLAYVTSGRRLVVISLAHVTSIDCSGLAALVSAYKRLGPAGELRLVSACPAARALLAATHLDELLPVLEDLADAASP
jgi:anti-sigma B factor antagonist